MLDLVSRPIASPKRFAEVVRGPARVRHRWLGGLNHMSETHSRPPHWTQGTRRALGVNGAGELHNNWTEGR
jgi:hypothetical protein